MQVKAITGYQKPQYPNKEKLLSKPEVLKQWMPTRWKQSLIIPGILAAALAINPGVLKAATEVNFGGKIEYTRGTVLPAQYMSENTAWSIASTVFGEKGYTLIPTREYYNTLTGEVFTEKEMKDVTGLSPDYMPLSGYCPKLNLGVYLYTGQEKHSEGWLKLFKLDPTVNPMSYTDNPPLRYRFIPKREKKKNLRDQNMNLVCFYATDDSNKDFAETRLKNAITEFLDNPPAELKQTDKTKKPKQ